MLVKMIVFFIGRIMQILIYVPYIYSSLINASSI